MQMTPLSCGTFSACAAKQIIAPPISGLEPVINYFAKMKSSTTSSHLFFFLPQRKQRREPHPALQTALLQRGPFGVHANRPVCPDELLRPQLFPGLDPSPSILCRCFQLGLIRDAGREKSCIHLKMRTQREPLGLPVLTSRLRWQLCLCCALTSFPTIPTNVQPQ